jgi:hypothetical protein
MTIRYRHR